MALSLGTAPAIAKYGEVFSALQFLLSADRTQYAAGPALLARYVGAHVTAILVLALTQAPLWSGAAPRGRRG